MIIPRSHITRVQAESMVQLESTVQLESSRSTGNRSVQLESCPVPVPRYAVSDA
jgi:hypothetical protein